MATKPYDRVKNTNNASDNFLRTPYWDAHAEEGYQVWLKSASRESPPDLLDEYLLNGIAVSFKLLESSVCCTLINVALRDKEQPHLLTGWADNWNDALLVAHYKITEQLGGNWVSVDTGRKVPRR